MQPTSNLEQQSQIAQFGLRQAALSRQCIQTLQQRVAELTEALQQAHVDVADYKASSDAYEENARAARQIITDLVFKLEHREVMDPHKVIADLREVMEELHDA